jgi:poly(hydroxyalkanoate) depolymerase family esterase
MRPHSTHSFVSPLLLVALATLAPACASRPDGEPQESTGSVASELGSGIVEVTGFGSNPGALKMYEYVPAGLAANKPVVLVLHGCTETAENAAVTGWNQLADEVGFTVVYPEQQTINNSLRCFNWAGEYGVPDNLQRGKGENLSIKQMVDKTIAAHGSDAKQVFVVGFSAGGGTAAIMAATYPDVFAGAATIAGIPYDCTTTYAEVNGCMKPGKTKTAADWATLAKAGDPGFSGPWPRMSIWQGSADTTVSPTNRTELVKQWTGVHGVDGKAPVTDTVDGQSHAVYTDSANKPVVETFEIAGMTHGVPVLPTAKCGTAGTYAFDKGICASRRIATFFGITTGGSTGDGGASSSSGSSGTSGGVSSSSSTGGVSGDGGASSSSGNGADPGDSNARHGSTCTVTRAVGGGAASNGAVLVLGFLLTLTVLARRDRGRPPIPPERGSRTLAGSGSLRAANR